MTSQSGALDAEAEVTISDPHEVERLVRQVRRQIQQCLNVIYELRISVNPFHRNTIMCEAIERNLVNLADTLKLIRFFTAIVENMVRDLSESLELCVQFLSEFALSKGAERRAVYSEEEYEEITNKLAFMNKLLHLNQHSLNIRLLIEQPDHTRIAREQAEAKEREKQLRAKQAKLRDARAQVQVEEMYKQQQEEKRQRRESGADSGRVGEASVLDFTDFDDDGDDEVKRVVTLKRPVDRVGEISPSPSLGDDMPSGGRAASKSVFRTPDPAAKDRNNNNNKKNGSGGGGGGREADNKRFRNMRDMAYGKPHRNQLAYGRINAPVSFNSRARAEEWATIEKKLRRAQPMQPVVLFLDGPRGVGKTSFARYIATRLFSYLDYHCLYSSPDVDDMQWKGGAHSASSNNSSAGPSSVHRVVDADTIMRSFFAESQLVTMMTSGELRRAYRHAVLDRRGVLLLDNMQSPDQVLPLLPARGRCVVIVTSRDPFSVFWRNVEQRQRQSGGGSKDKPRTLPLIVHHRVRPLLREETTAVLERNPLVMDEVVTLARVSKGSPLALYLMSRNISAANPSTAVAHELSSRPSEDLERFMTQFSDWLNDTAHRRRRAVAAKKGGSGGGSDDDGAVYDADVIDEIVDCERASYRMLYYAMSRLDRPRQDLLMLLSVFPSSFDAQSAKLIVGHTLAEMMMRDDYYAGDDEEKRNKKTEDFDALFDTLRRNGLVLKAERHTEQGDQRRRGVLLAAHADAAMEESSAKQRTADKRYVLHGLVREFGRFWLQERGRKALQQRLGTVWERFVLYFAERVSQLDELQQRRPTNPNIQQRVFTQFDLEAHNIRAAQQMAFHHKSTSRAALRQLLRPRTIYEVRVSPHRRGVLLSRYLKLVQPLGLERADAYRALADMHVETGSYEKAMNCYKQCQDAGEKHQSPEHVARALLGLSYVSREIEEYQVGLEYSKKCEAILREQLALALEKQNKNKNKSKDKNKELGESSPLKPKNNVSNDSSSVSSPRGVAESSTTTRKIEDAAGWYKELGVLLLFTTTLYRPIGAYQNCVDLARQSVEMSKKAGDTPTLAKGLVVLGDMYLQIEDWPQAIKFMDECRQLSHEEGDLRSLARCLAGLHKAHERQKQFFKAHCYSEQLSQLQALSDLPLI
eukprot:TRINITY_DN66222_c4_g10_i1.p1 TRINITY_DN66222_c4_g10~~TRINITY_DN66222_c4_g10_i1.p1  ORF type:complete len:1148 (+),score=657.42 TRINITY_DN66222_c4_g10_i1:37-3480(+)